MPETIFERQIIFVRPQPTQEQALAFTPSQTQDKILEALFTLYLATNTQLTRLLYSEGTYSTVKGALAELVREEYLVILNEEQRKKHKTMKAVYGIGSEGRKYLKHVKRKPINWRYRGIKERISKDAPLEHSLMVVDLLISALLLGHEVPQIKLVDNAHEILLKREPLLIPELANPRTKKPYELKPDLFLDFAAGKERITPFFEANRTDPGQSTWRYKVRAYSYALPPLHERFESNNLVICVVIAGDEKEKRMDDMRNWTRKEMKKLGISDHDDLFLFTTASVNLSPTEFFMGKHWYTPFSDIPEPLLYPVRKAGAVD